MESGYPKVRFQTKVQYARLSPNQSLAKIIDHSLFTMLDVKCTRGKLAVDGQSQYDIKVNLLQPIK
jgi:hypothetical protein